MIRTIAIGVAGLLLVMWVAGFFWARAIFATDTIRSALAAQLSTAIGQPVAIGAISAGLYPRVAVDLADVTIGQPVRIQARRLRVGADFWALVSRRIAHGSVRLDGVRAELPLPPLGPAHAAGAGQEPGGWPVAIVSVDEILVSDARFVSGGRTLRADIEAVPHDGGLTLRQLSLTADETNIGATGELTSLSGPVGHIDIHARALDLGELLEFLTAFASGSGMAGHPPPRDTSAVPAAGTAKALDVTLALGAERATAGALVLERLTGRARVTRNGVVVDPVDFGVFAGHSSGSLVVSAGTTPGLRVRVALSNIDVAAALAFAGTPGTMTGRLSGRLDVTGPGAGASQAFDNARGTARVDIRDGIVRNLGLVRTVVVATSMRGDAQPVPAGGSNNDERFTLLGATLAIANGVARTSDLEFESPDVSLRAAGSVRLDGRAIDLRGNVQLSDELSRQAGRDLLRYTQEQGRVTLPATVTGSAQSPVVRIDAAQLATRALKNRITEEATKAIKKGLGDLAR